MTFEEIMEAAKDWEPDEKDIEAFRLLCEKQKEEAERQRQAVMSNEFLNRQYTI